MQISPEVPEMRGICFQTTVKERVSSRLHLKSVVTHRATCKEGGAKPKPKGLHHVDHLE